jgi:hypothetical protein
VPNLVARHVLTVLLELNAEPLVRRPVQPRAKPFDDLPRHHLQVADLLQIVGIQKVSDVRH